FDPRRQKAKYSYQFHAKATSRWLVSSIRIAIWICEPRELNHCEQPLPKRYQRLRSQRKRRAGMKSSYSRLKSTGSPDGIETGYYASAMRHMRCHRSTGWESILPYKMV